MNRQEFEHIIRACGAATSCKELLIVGSQAILGSVPDSPRELRVSLELDVSPIPFSEEAVAIIDGNIGELSQFHKNFHIYAHGVGPDTATVPEDYRTRLVTVTVGGVSAHCVSPASRVPDIWRLDSTRSTQRRRTGLGGSRSHRWEWQLGGYLG